METLQCRRTRIAPTPSGYLHIGNAVSFVITAILAKHTGAVMRLRIDDLDRERCKEVYIDDIFFALEWLGLNLDEGPSGTSDFVQSHSQHFRIDQYLAAIDELEKRGALYPCDCSRAEFASRSGLYCACKGQKVTPRVQRLATVPDRVTITELDGHTEQVATIYDPGPVVIRQQNGLPSYQVASLCDDAIYEVDLIVRGADLLGSTAIQLHLADTLQWHSFSASRFFHHALMMNSGTKLSKSAGSTSLKQLRNGGMTKREFFGHIAEIFGIPPKGGNSIDTLYQQIEEDAFRRWRNPFSTPQTST